MATKPKAPKRNNSGFGGKKLTTLSKGKKSKNKK